MPNLEFTLATVDNESSITVYLPGQPVQVAHEDHPNFDEIKGYVLDIAADNDGLSDDDVDELLELFDTSIAVKSILEPLSQRIRVANGRVYFDGDEVHNALTDQIIRFRDEGVEDYIPLVNFFERVQSNPNEHSREQLYTWLSQRDFTITKAGLIVGYKGVRTTDNGYESIHHGPAIVNGRQVNGSVPNNVGDVVEMPRSQVAHDPATGCSSGLHVGTYDYARSFSQGAVLEVHVDPRDVVSVPTDCGWAKVRTCRYTVIGSIDTPYNAPVLDPDGDLSSGVEHEDDAELYC